MSEYNQLIRDLMTIPGIVSQLGASIAEAQRLFDAKYLQSTREFLRLFRAALGNDFGAPSAAEGSDAAPQDVAQVVLTLLREAGPSRYQFTETELEFRAELVQSTDLVVSGGLSAGYAGVALNVSGSYGSRSDYSAAARIKTTLHAVPGSKEVFDKLLGRVSSMPRLPDTKISEQVRGVNADMLKELAQVRDYLGDDKVGALLKSLDLDSVQDEKSDGENNGGS